MLKTKQNKREIMQKNLMKQFFPDRAEARPGEETHLVY